MTVLFDTCVIVDALQDRQPFAKSAQLLFMAVANQQIRGCITAKALTDIFYLTHRFTHDNQATRAVLSKLLSLFELLDTTALDCRYALASGVADYEDAVMIETAARAEMDCIVTRNLHDYRKSTVAVSSPEELLERIMKDDI